MKKSVANQLSDQDSASDTGLSLASSDRRSSVSDDGKKRSRWSHTETLDEETIKLIEKLDATSTDMPLKEQ